MSSDVEISSAPYDLGFERGVVTGRSSVLPDDVTAAHLRWLETGEGDPWGGADFAAGMAAGAAEVHSEDRPELPAFVVAPPTDEEERVALFI